MNTRRIESKPFLIPIDMNLLQITCFFYELYNEINFNRADIIHHKYCHIMMDYIAFFLIA